MVDDEDPTLSFPDPTARAARRAFLDWQCRIRQIAVRRDAGRPSAGMCPIVTLARDGTDLGRIVVLIRRRDSRETTARFQHMVRKTRDPAERRESALGFLAEAYYQRPEEFSDELTALFGPGSTVARRLLDAGECALDFRQFRQHFRLRCRVGALAETDGAYQFTYWHNSLFNPAIPGGFQILGFRPDWLHPAETASRDSNQNFP